MSYKAIAALGALTFLLAGCAAASTSVPAPSATSTPTSAPVLADPVVRFDLGCDDLAGTDLLAPLVPAGSTMVPLERNLVDDGPWAAVLPTAGALECRWTTTSTDLNDFLNISVTVVPDAAAGWAQYVADGAGDYRGCNDARGDGCSAIQLVGDYWVDAQVNFDLNSSSDPNAPADSADIPNADAYLDDVLARVAALGAANPRWTPPSTAVPSTCDALLSPAMVGDALGTTGVETLSTADAALTQHDAAGDLVGALECSWGAGDGSSVAYAYALPGGDWLRADYEGSPAGEHADSPVPVEIAGLGASDAAFEVCGPGDCNVDVFIGGDWLRVRASVGDSLSLAAAVVANLLEG